MHKPPRRAAAPDSRGLSNPIAPSGVGFVLVDASLEVLYANSEAVHILTYPAAPTMVHALDPDVAKKVRAQLESSLPSPRQSALTELSSGRRRYLCHAFELGPKSGSSFPTISFQPRIALLIERGQRAVAELAQVGEQYHLTPREREAMALLLHGLTSKEIAERMNVSPNTVKAFLRLIMLRMNVSTRSGIVGKILVNAF
jgi:DNA-binding CsgD family transcriptional regulator